MNDKGPIYLLLFSLRPRSHVRESFFLFLQLLVWKKYPRTHQNFFFLNNLVHIQPHMCVKLRSGSITSKHEDAMDNQKSEEKWKWYITGKRHNDNSNSNNSTRTLLSYLWIWRWNKKLIKCKKKSHLTTLVLDVAAEQMKGTRKKKILLKKSIYPLLL